MTLLIKNVGYQFLIRLDLMCSMSLWKGVWVIRAPFFLIGIHSMQGWTATTRQELQEIEAHKRLQDTENLFRKNLHLKDVC